MIEGEDPDVFFYQQLLPPGRQDRGRLVRHIVKGTEPVTVTETHTASTTDLSTVARARTAFDHIDKGRVRGNLASEQGWLCAFCMRRISPDATDARGERTMKIAHRTPIDVDPAQALSWRNLLGSCDGGQRSGWRTRSCDAAQGSTALTVDPTVEASCAQLRHERRERKEGLFITSNHPGSGPTSTRRSASTRAISPCCGSRCGRPFAYSRRSTHRTSTAGPLGPRTSRRGSNGRLSGSPRCSA